MGMISGSAITPILRIHLPSSLLTKKSSRSISLWAIHKKKPIFTIPIAHGKPKPLSPLQYTAESDIHTSTFPPPPPQPRSITALAAIPYSDTFFSGSYDGFVRVWRVSTDKKRIEPMGRLGITEDPCVTAVTQMESAPSSTTITASPTPPPMLNSPARGVVNGISVFESGEAKDVSSGKAAGDLYVAVALGKEMRLGRWLTVPGKNGAVLFKVLRRDGNQTKENTAAAILPPEVGS